MTIATVHRELALDLAGLAEAESSGIAAFRVWTTDEPVVIVGRSVSIEEEVQVQFCHREGIEIVERPSGGRSVLIGPGTAQYSFTLPYSLDDELGSISGSKSFCNRLLRSGSPELSALSEDASGDLLLGSRKVAGLALKRGRNAMLLHGTILVAADLDLIAQALQHPKREPAYRAGRSHEDFLENIGRLDSARLVAAVNSELKELGTGR